MADFAVKPDALVLDGGCLCFGNNEQTQMLALKIVVGCLFEALPACNCSIQQLIPPKTGRLEATFWKF